MAECQTLRFTMFDDLPTSIEATLLRPRLIGADGVPHIEQSDDPSTWRDDGDVDLVAVGRGIFTVLVADDRATLEQVDDSSEAMAVRARFEPLAGCPQPQMADTLAVSLGASLTVAFEVLLTGEDMTQTPGWTPLMVDGPRPGELVLVLREDVGVVTP